MQKHPGYDLQMHVSRHYRIEFAYLCGFVIPCEYRVSVAFLDLTYLPTVSLPTRQVDYDTGAILKQGKQETPSRIKSCRKSHASWLMKWHFLSYLSKTSCKEGWNLLLFLAYIDVCILTLDLLLASSFPPHVQRKT